MVQYSSIAYRVYKLKSDLYQFTCFGWPKGKNVKWLTEQNIALKIK